MYYRNYRNVYSYDTLLHITALGHGFVFVILGYDNVHCVRHITGLLPYTATTPYNRSLHRAMGLYLIYHRVICHHTLFMSIRPVDSTAPNSCAQVGPNLIDIYFIAVTSISCVIE